MYNMPYFKETDLHQLHDFMRQYPFATLCGTNKDGVAIATHIPLLLEEREDELYLSGHIMRDTDHHLAFLNNPGVLAVFHGPHAYVSASWYSNPQQASTWNYMVVHARGTLKFSDERALINILEKTTAYFENDENSPALVQKMPVGYVQRLLPYIIGFEIKITDLENVFKLSQNKKKQEFEHIIQQLKGQSNEGNAISLEMEKRKNKIFPS